MPEGFEWANNSDRRTSQAIGLHGRTVREQVLRLCEAWAADLAAQMPVNAPWTDRSGNARQTLSARAYGDPDGDGEMGVEIAHGVNYGVYLELGNDGRFAILKPTVDENQNEFTRSVQDLVE